MCLIAFAYKQHPDFPFILIANRDEFYNRATSPLAFWDDQPSILAGRDLEQMGTWLGINRNGRLTALTNYRDGRQKAQNKRSRGELTRVFLEGTLPASAHISQLAESADNYAGFNLLAGDQSGLYYLSHLRNYPVKLDNGVFSLSNAVLDSPWPKANYLKESLEGLIGSDEINTDSLTQLLLNTEEAADSSLPETGISYEWEKRLSACFINMETYGTRACSVIIQDKHGMTAFKETSFNEQGLFKVVEYKLQCKPIG